MNNKSSTEASSSFYTVGAAARLSGLTPGTIRNWERRHAAIRPARAPNGQRRFSSEDVLRLKTLAELTRAGHAISALAPLPQGELQILGRDLGGGKPVAVANDTPRLRVVTVGARAGAHIQALTDSHAALDLVRQFPFAEDLLREDAEVACDILVVHTPHILPGTGAWLHGLRRRANPKHVVVVYEFARLALARSLRNANTSVLQGFRHLEPFLRIWLPERAATRVLHAGVAAVREPSPEAPLRNYSMGVLTALQQQDSAGLLCDCQRHLARMVEQIYDFEDYTDQCADLTDEDRHTHQDIRRMMLSARVQVEAALRAACEHAERAHAPRSNRNEEQNDVESASL